MGRSLVDIPKNRSPAVPTPSGDLFLCHDYRALTYISIGDIINNMSELQVRPVANWTYERTDGTVELCDIFTGEPLRGLDFDKIPGPISPAFENDFDLLSGYKLWKENAIVTGLYVADPTKPHGLNSEMFMDLAAGADMIGYANTRSVLFTARQHGLDTLAPGMLFDNPQPDPQYEAELAAALKKLGKPHFTFDPSLDRGKPGYDKVFQLQLARNMLYDEARSLDNLATPGKQFKAQDVAYTHQQQSWMMGSLGTRVIDEADSPRNEFYGDLPERLMLVTAPENMGIANKLEALGNTAMIDFADNGAVLGNDPDYQLYDNAVRTGYVQ